MSATLTLSAESLSRVIDFILGCFTLGLFCFVLLCFFFCFFFHRVVMVDVFKTFARSL